MRLFTCHLYTSGPPANNYDVQETVVLLQWAACGVMLQWDAALCVSFIALHDMRCVWLPAAAAAAAARCPIQIVSGHLYNTGRLCL